MILSLRHKYTNPLKIFNYSPMKKLHTLFIITILAFTHFESSAKHNASANFDGEPNTYSQNITNPESFNDLSLSNKVSKWHLLGKVSLYNGTPAPSLGCTYRIHNFHIGLDAKYGDIDYGKTKYTPYIEFNYNLINNYSDFYLMPGVSFF